MSFSRESTIGEILENEKATAVLVSFIGEDLLNNPMLDMAKRMKLKQIARIKASGLTKEMLLAIEAELVKL